PWCRRAARLPARWALDAGSVTRSCDPADALRLLLRAEHVRCAPLAYAWALCPGVTVETGRFGLPIPDRPPGSASSGRSLFVPLGVVSLTCEEAECAPLPTGRAPKLDFGEPCALAPTGAGGGVQAAWPAYPTLAASRSTAA